jgi:hypothetical protein
MYLKQPRHNAVMILFLVIEKPIVAPTHTHFGRYKTGQEIGKWTIHLICFDSYLLLRARLSALFFGKSDHHLVPM